MTEDSLRYFLRRVGLVEDRVRALIDHRRSDDPAPDDPFRGLFLSDETIDQLLGPVKEPPPGDQTERWAADAAADEKIRAGELVRLRQLITGAELSDLDSELLLIALLPDLDSRFERFYGYLNDDVTRRRATVGLALAIADVSAASALARARLLPGGPLVDLGLVLVEDADRPFLTRALRVPDRVTAHLLGSDAPDPALTDVLVEVEPMPGDQANRLARAMSVGQRLVYVRDVAGGIGAAVCASAMGTVGRPVLAVDVARWGTNTGAADAVTVLGREALLRGAGVVAAPVESLIGVPEAIRRLAGLPVPVALIGAITWDPNWTAEVPLLLDVPILTPTERTGLWTRALDRLALENADIRTDARSNGNVPTNPLLPEAARLDASGLPVHFVLGPRQVLQAVRSAAAAATLGNGNVTAEGLRSGARAQNAAGLERLARRVVPAVGWADLVLPASARTQLHDLASRARLRDQVLVEWGMRPGGGRGRGVTALFAGDSGTGKTMSAEVIAADLGLDLYTVNLATVVDKYIGETEKNLERIFTEAGGVNAVLLFDEADAIFGKRSEVRDAHDRYANIESAYLLQRMETFDGLAVLSTNLRSNIDDAFTRRLDMIIDFPAPDEEARLVIWQQCLAPPVPCVPNLDLEFCARSFALSGGNIRSAATTAGYLAAGRASSVGMPEIISAIQQEYRKLGRLVLEREFGEYFSKPSPTQAPR